jgi:glyoxylase-like metal-dependent hydrolase (beta-lactamase superfamily II)
MILRQFLHTSPVVAISYLFGCGGKGVCAVCDPMDAAETYLRAAQESHMAIKYVIDTHVHADHLSSGRRLAGLAGAAQCVLHSSAGAHFDFLAVNDNDVLDLGNVQIRILHTPGHTPEHVSLLVTDKTRGPEPWFLLTGHTLMVGDLGRTELVANAEEGARQLFETVQRLKSLPDYLEVLPGAFSGSVCGRSLSGKPMSTIGFERQFNPAFRIADKDEFIRHMLRDIPAPPPNAGENRAMNLGLSVERSRVLSHG